MILLELDQVYPSLNKWMRVHWRERARINNDWHWLILKAAQKACCGKPNYANAKVSIVLTFPVIRRRDNDNYTPKFVMDALVGAGILQDDNAKQVQTSVEIVVGKRTGMKIMIEEVADLG